MSSEVGMSRLTDEQLRVAYNAPNSGHLASLRAVADAAVAAYVAEIVDTFGYFRAEPFGWTECAPDDEGAVALYERPHHSEDKLEMVVPEGYALVPIEPTSVMVDAGYDAYGKGHFTPAIIDCYRAMVLAAQKETT